MSGPQPAKPSTPPIRSFAFLSHFCQPLRSDPSVIAGVDPMFTDPGFLTTTGVRKDQQLQGFVEEFLRKDAEKPEKRSNQAKLLGNLRFALVDLSKSDLDPKFAGHRETEQGGLGSMAKTGAMFAAFQLKFDLEVLAKRLSLTKDTLFDAVRALWSQTQALSSTPVIKELHASNPKIELHDQLVKAAGEAFPITFPLDAAAPKLERIFDVTQNGSDVKLEFKGSDRVQVGKPGAPDTSPAVDKYVQDTQENLTEVEKLSFAERLLLMIDESDNAASHTCVKDIGFLYIASTLWQSSIYEPNRGGGLWEGASHRGLEWHKSFMPQVGNNQFSKPDFQTSTAASVAALMTLLAQSQLVNPEASAAMRHLTSKRKNGLHPRDPRTRQIFESQSYTRSFFEEGLRFPVDQAHSKLGIGNFNNDCAFIVRKDRGKTLRYVATGFDEPIGFDGKLLHELITELDKCIQRNNGLDPLDGPPAPGP